MRKGFTLIELLLTVSIISLLAVSVFVALNPSQRLRDTKDARRSTDVDTILSAIHQSIIDDRGNLPTALSALGVDTWAQLGTDASGCALTTTYCSVAQAGCVNLMAGAENLATYLSAMPVDPDGSPSYTSGHTGYAVRRDANGIITVQSCGAENSDIEASR